jgi:hypothetical protein
MSSSIAPDSAGAPDSATVGPEALAAERPTAQVIAFPGRNKPVAVPVLGAPERLARALESLNAAMTEQRAALAAWRSALGTLKEATSGLGDSLRTYQSNLRVLGDGVSSLQAKARSLEQWAEAATSG